jgi:hypothetical protein
MTACDVDLGCAPRIKVAGEEEVEMFLAFTACDGGFVLGEDDVVIVRPFGNGSHEYNPVQYLCIV